jgi:5-methylcytosine-specific restriction protein A
VAVSWATSNRKSRLPHDWPTRRRAVLDRDAGICYLCGQPGADRVDHKTPGDDHSLANLGAVHDTNPPHCHRYKSSHEGAQARWKYSTERERETPPGML